MPEICRFFGIIIRMFFDEHDPPHFHIAFTYASLDLKANWINYRKAYEKEMENDKRRIS